MSALGHTMASMSRDPNGKPHAGSSNGDDTRRARNGRSGGKPQAASVNAGKGQNLNHLLSFTLPPRMRNSTATAAARRPRRTAGSVPFNKERYVNAQYRFLVKPTGDYTAYFADADIFLNWSDILTVLIPTTSALSTASHLSALGKSTNGADISSDPLEQHEGASCPVCLSTPTAPRMTKCGHVYCFACILHYLSVHDAPNASGSTTPTPNHSYVPGAGPRHTPTPNVAPPSLSSLTASAPKWKRCPVCWDAVYAKDLKAVQWWDPKARAEEFEHVDADAAHGSADRPLRPTADDYLCMRLIERPHLTTLALPQSSTWPTASTSSSDQPLIAQHSAPWHFQPDVMTFSKFMLATPEVLLRNLHGDLQELSAERDLLSSFMTKDEVGLLFVDMAERKVHEQMEKVTNELDTQSVRSRIGYAQKELAEHFEVERGNKERAQEAISRRQRKRLERERKEGGAETEAAEAHEVPPPLSSSEDGPIEQTHGAEEFLAHQAQQQGGRVTRAVETGESDEGNGKNDRKEGRQGTLKVRRNLNPPAPSSSSFFFFQASSGQNIFLHPLDIKILLSAFGSYAAFPRTLQICVQGAQEGSMNEEMQKRCKYLTHLSKGADIVFIEVDWDKMVHDAEQHDQPPPIPRSAMRMYEQAIRQRRNRRRDRERREDRAKLRSEEQERATRPAMSTAAHIPIGGFGAASRSPALSASDAGLLGSSFGSQLALSPSVQEAILLSHERGHGSSDDDFPTAQHALQDDEHDVTADGEGETRQARSGQRNGQGTTVTKTVWGTLAARGNGFDHALHNSSRGAANDDGPDWDSWLELEEDFIVGARNGNSVREGRGLNRQGRKSNVAVTAAHDSPSLQMQTGTRSEADEGKTGQPGDATPTEARSAQTGGKQQKKKKLVLTAGGGGRGTR